MHDRPLPDVVAHQRTRVSTLQARLAPRHAAEAAELTTLATEQKNAEQRATAAATAITRATENLAALEQRRLTLEQGLSNSRRSWLRLGEPALASLLLFFSLTVVGAAVRQHSEMIAIEAVGFSVGLLIAKWKGSRR